MRSPSPLADHPILADALRRIERRLRLRRLVAALVVWAAAVVSLLLLTVAGSSAAATRLLGAAAADGALVVIAFAILGAVAAVAYALAWTAPADLLARRLDRDLGLDDRVASALAALDASSHSPLAPLVVADAEAAVGAALAGDAAPLRRAVPLRPSFAVFRWAVRAAFLAVAVGLALLLLRAIPELPPGAFSWIGIRPGDGLTEDGEVDPEIASSDGAESDDSPADDDAASPGGEDAADPPEPGEQPPADPPAEAATPPARVRLRFPREEYEPGAPIPAVVSAVPTGEPNLAPSYRVDIEVDGERVETEVVLTVSRDVPEGVAEALDLRTFPRLWPQLEPGTHEARAYLVPRTTGAPGDTEPTDPEPIVSEPAEFRIRGESGGGGGSSPEPEPQQSPDQPPPDAAPPPPPPPPPPQDAGEGDSPPPEQPQTGLPPPPEREKVAVLPLFGDGETVEKEGPVLVLGPVGGAGSPTERRPLAEVLPAARRRLESRLDRPGIRPEDRELLRRYFEALARRVR